jgi:transcriptional regulator with PAS, ATPase and Fis domain
MRVSFEDWLRDRFPLGFPACILVDLRQGESWSRLNAKMRLGRVGFTAAIPLLGVVAPVCPLPWLHLGDVALRGMLTWPCPPERLKRRLERATRSGSGGGMSTCVEPCVVEGGGHQFVTHSPELFPAFEQLVLAAKHDESVLLIGETGTGKTTLAKIIHALSPRATERLLTVACGALPNELIGSELFGHVKGAFTSAEQTKIGKFDVADGGTILLDEVDLLGFDQQANLLRVLETGEFEPVGSNVTHKVDVRVIGASNQSLERAIAEGRFRADLFYRLNQMTFVIPPLRKRVRDIIPLSIKFIEECSLEKGIAVRGITPELVETLKHYDWPGNVRELRNETRRAVIFSRDGLLTTDALSTQVIEAVDKRLKTSEHCSAKLGLAREVAQTERETIERMLKRHEFNRSAAARELGISRVTLYNKIHKYGIQLRTAP